MKGFFDKENIKEIPYKSEKGVHSCVSCGLYKSAGSPKIKPYGEFKEGIMVIGEAPGEDDDRIGTPWQGETGRLLQQKYRQLGIDLFEDCISLNAVNCRPTDKHGEDRAPTEFEISCCRQKIISSIKKYKPKVIILHGAAPISSLIGYKWRRNLGGVEKWRGWAIPDRDYHAWICPTFAPSFVKKQESPNEVDIIWSNDLKQAFGKVNDPFPVYKKEEDSITTHHTIEQVLISIEKEFPPLLAFDIETTGLKPYDKNIHKIISISFCWEDDKAYAIPFPTEKRHLRLLKRILENPRIGKIAANMKYEDTWMNIMNDINVHPWKFDTMQASHILDNRPGISGLKFQSYVQFGVLGYDEVVESYLKSSNTNIPNKIEEMTKDKNSFHELLIYNGIDSLLEYRLAKKQMKELNMEVK